MEKVINPISGRKITVGGGVYNSLVRKGLLTPPKVKKFKVINLQEQEPPQTPKPEEEEVGWDFDDILGDITDEEEEEQPEEKPKLEKKILEMVKEEPKEHIKEEQVVIDEKPDPAEKIIKDMSEEELKAVKKFLGVS